MADPYARLRLRAHETRAFADKTSDPEAKHILLEIADEFESLATFDATRVPKGSQAVARTRAIRRSAGGHSKHGLCSPEPTK
jgi:hypothetical protein